MAISYPITLPEGVAKIKLEAENKVGIAQSETSFAAQKQVHAGKRWRAAVTLPPMKQEEAEVYLSALISLNGMEGSFLMGDPTRINSMGSASTTAGTPVVDGANQTGNSLNIKGLPASATGYLKIGDYIQLGSGSASRLYKVLEQVDSDSAGKATLTLWPNIRSVTLDNEAVTVNNCRAVWRLVSNVTDWDINRATIYGISFECVEDL